MGLSKRHHHSQLLNALKVPSVIDVISKNVYSFYNRALTTKSPVQEIQSRFLSHYMLNGAVIKNTLLEKLLSYDLNPLECLFNYKKVKYDFTCNGVTESLRFLSLHDNYVKPWTSEFLLVKLLTQSF